MTCRDAEPLLHARLDNELDAAGLIAIDGHLSECVNCEARYAALQSLHEEISGAALIWEPPIGLMGRLSSKLPKPFWTKTTAGLATLAVAAIMLVALLPVLRPGLRQEREADAIAAEIVDAHLRALEPEDSVDVPSSDRHTVKPWFQGKTSFSPPVPDLTKEGFELIGGRLEVIHRQPAAAIVYKLRQHVIGLYVGPWPGADSAPENRDLGGYHVVQWRQKDLGYWAVSDVDAAELSRFARLIRDR